MKITYLSYSTIPSRTANSIHVMKMCQALAKNGHIVTLVGVDSRKKPEPGIKDIFAFYGIEKCFDITRFPWLSLKFGGYLYSFLAAVRAKHLGCDLVYGRNLLACFFAVWLGLPTIYESHSSGDISNIISGWVFRSMISSPRFLKFVVITSSLKQYYDGKYPRIKKKIVVCPDAADPVSKNAVPIDLPNKGKRLQVGYVGHLYVGRGIELIEQLAEETAEWADFHLVGGIEQDIRKFRRRTAHVSNIFIVGFLRYAEAERFRIACDVLLAPYRSDHVSVAGRFAANRKNTVRWMSPLKIFEYMAAGKPIICSDMPVLREVLKNESNALLCPSEDVSAWIRCLERLKGDMSLRKRLGDRARENFAARHTWQARASLAVTVSGRSPGSPIFR